MTEITGDTVERLVVPDTVEELMKLWEDEPFARTGSNEFYQETADTKAERTEVKRAFIAGEVENPQVSYPRLNGDELRDAHERMLAMYERLTETPDSPDKDLARQLMRRKIMEIDRHLEVVAAWATDDPAERQEHLDRAAEIQMTVFGSPEQSHFDRMLHDTRSKAEALVAFGDHDEVAKAAKELLELTGERPVPEDAPVFGLSDTAREVLKSDITLLWQENVFLPASAEKIPHERARQMFQLVQQLAGMNGWDTELKSGNAAETSRRRQVVSIGRNRAEFTGQTIREKNIHETLGHGRRAFNGDRLADKGLVMARFALPDSLDFEEGLLVALEQIEAGKPRTPGEQYYTAAGLMLGMDRDGEKRDFRKTYEIMWRRSIVEDATAGKQVDVEKAKGAAYQTMMRTTRGGALDTRDLSYYRGYVKASAWLNDMAELPSFDRVMQWHYVMQAQFDPTNPMHAAYIKRGYDPFTVYKQL